MNDRILAVLEKYPIKVNQTHRGRGAIFCETEGGVKLLREFKGSAEKAERINSVLKRARNLGFEHVDCFVENAEGQLVTAGEDGVQYILKDWFRGSECDVKSEKDLFRAAEKMALLHHTFRQIPLSAQEQAFFKIHPFGEKFEKHNKELRKIRNFMRRQAKKTEFELYFLDNFDFFFQQGQDAEAEARAFQAASQGKLASLCMLCHGDYNQHNVLMLERGVAITNFDRLCQDVQLLDLYQFLRKIMEKHQWNIALGQAVIRHYALVRPISEEEMLYLRIHLLYPEKFWKLANQYYNSNKAWISGKSTEKLKRLVEQNRLRDQFLDSMMKIR